MTLLSMYKRDDSRTVYRILAEQAVKFLDHPQAGTDSKITFTNLARLLERYQYDAFSYDAAPGILEVFQSDADAPRKDYGSTGGQATLEIMPALEAAHARVYHQLSKEDLVRNLKVLLSQLASATVPDDQDTHEDLVKARQFFETLSEGLRKRGL